MVWGVVKDGRLVHVKGAGVQDIESKRPVTADTLFRIASMTKAFTALSVLKLRDDGKLVARRAGRDLRARAAGLAAADRGLADDPRPRAHHPHRRLRHRRPVGRSADAAARRRVHALLRDGVPFTRPTATAMEYSNLGYALLGRIVANVSGQPYKDFVQRTLLGPLGMTATGYDVAAAPAERRALGYRWEDGAWKLEPTMAHGAFGAMGGIQTSATDYAKWVAYLLSAWPPRDGADTGPVRRSSVRELAQGGNYASVRLRPGASGADACRSAGAYGMGMNVAVDCELGLTLSHGGGYPGYGSHVLLLPDYGVGHLRAGQSHLRRSAQPGVGRRRRSAAGRRAPRRGRPPCPARSRRPTRAVGTMWAAGAVTAPPDALAMNFLMDRDADHWARDLAALKADVGACDTTAPIAATGALSGEFTWTCARGRVQGSVLLAPTRDATHPGAQPLAR